MGLVQIFRASSCPPLVAGRLLALVLADFHETGHHYLLQLVVNRGGARRDGDVEAVAVLNEAIREHAIHEQIPQRWQLRSLFSFDAYATFGDGLLAVWAGALIQICLLEQYWDDIVLGYRPTCPYFLAGFHADEKVYSTDWLDDLRPGWSTRLTVFVTNHDGICLPLTRERDDDHPADDVH